MYFVSTLGRDGVTNVTEFDNLDVALFTFIRSALAADENATKSVTLDFEGPEDEQN